MSNPFSDPPPQKYSDPFSDDSSFAPPSSSQPYDPYLTKSYSSDIDDGDAKDSHPKHVLFDEDDDARDSFGDDLEVRRSVEVPRRIEADEDHRFISNDDLHSRNGMINEVEFLNGDLARMGGGGSYIPTYKKLYANVISNFWGVLTQFSLLLILIPVSIAALPTYSETKLFFIHPTLQSLSLIFFVQATLLLQPIGNPSNPASDHTPHQPELEIDESKLYADHRPGWFKKLNFFKAGRGSYGGLGLDGVTPPATKSKRAGVNLQVEKKKSIWLHRLLNLIGLASLTAGTTLVIVGKNILKKKHIQTFHSGIGILTFSFLLIQLTIGLLLVSFPTLFGGNQKSKSFYKWHRVSGYTLLFLLLTTILSALNSDFITEKLKNWERGVVAIGVLGVAIGTLARIKRTKFNFGARSRLQVRSG